LQDQSQDFGTLRSTQGQGKGQATAHKNYFKLLFETTPTLIYIRDKHKLKHTLYTNRDTVSSHL